MPRRAAHTRRGSDVAVRRRAQEARWSLALADHARDASVSIRRLAMLHTVDYTALYRRAKRYDAARAVRDVAGMHAATRVRRGGHNRTFNDDQEQLLAETVAAAQPAMGHQQIREAAMQLAHDVGVARRVRDLRSRRAFTASDGFVSAFKVRARLSSHRTALDHVSAREAGRRDVEEESFQYVTAVRGAIDSYGAHRVLNMDETPTSMCDAPVTGVVRTGSNGTARITTDFLTRHNITTFPCIAADGSKLQLCAILKGKTSRSLKKVEDGASADVRRVRLYLSHKGWMTTEIMKKWFTDVVEPYTHGEPAALILDRYGCHWTDDVVAAAAAFQLELIQVPGGETSKLQPLDVAFNGPMLKARQRIWREKKLRRPGDPDSYQAAIERSQQAYASMSADTVRKAFRKAWLID